jgi:hypothetical protein
MALVLRDRVKETTTTTGTATYTLAGAITGFESFGSVGDSNTTYYGCSDGTDFEVGIGTYTASGTTLARTVILQSSNSDSAVNWGAGTKTIFCTLPAEKMSFLDASGNLVAANASALTALNASNLASGTVDNARLDQQLQDVAGLAVTDGNFIVGDGANFVAESGATARTSLGLGTAATSDSTDFVAVTGDAMTGDLTFGDNDKAVFGAGSDLQIYHDASNSYIKDAGTGDLLVQGTQIKLQDASGNDYLRGFTGGAVYLHHAGNTKFETTATGVAVTGTLAATAVTGDGSGLTNLPAATAGFAVAMAIAL